MKCGAIFVNSSCVQDRAEFLGTWADATCGSLHAAIKPHLSMAVPTRVAISTNSLVLLFERFQVSRLRVDDADRHLPTWAQQSSARTTSRGI